MTTTAVAAAASRPGRIRVASVDDDTLIRAGLATLFPDFDVVGTYDDVEKLLAERPDVDLVLLDLVLTGTGRRSIRQGAVAVGAVATVGYPVLIYTNERRREVLATCLAAGAKGIVHKAEPLEEVTDAAHRIVDDGEVVITTALTGLAEVIDRHGDMPTLSPRQRQILSARARAEPFSSIAGRLFITEKTAQEHMKVVATKFADYLTNHSAADLERHLGFEPEDSLEWS